MEKIDSDRPLIHLVMHTGKVLNERLRSTLGERGIHFGQARILTALMRHGTLPQKVIARGVHIQPASVTNLVKKMEKSGLIERTRDLEDERIVNVTLTPEGEEAAEFAKAVMAQIERDIRSELSGQEIRALHDPLLKIRNKFGGTDPTL